MSAVVDLKTKEEKDAELDRRIEALRKKNEALVKRYQEIQEDKKKAEQEGIAVTTTRKPRPHEPDSEQRKTEKENFTVTVDISKPAGEKHMVSDGKPATYCGDHGVEEGESGRSFSEGLPYRTGSGRLSRGGHRGGRREPRLNKGEPRSDWPPQDGEGGEGPARSERSSRGGRRGGRGGGGTPGGSGSDRKSKEWEEKRRQNIEKMNEEMEKIAEYERGQRAEREKNPTRHFLDDPRRSGPIPDTDRKEGSRRHVRNWGGVDFDNVKTGTEVEKEWMNRRPSGKGSVDMTLSMTGRERAEYLRWKKEREQIDEERLARHRNATGQWKREWDAQKTDQGFCRFKEESAVAGEGTPEQSNRRAARGRNAHVQRRSGSSEDSKRPPRDPTFGDFLGQTKSRQGGRGRGKGRGQGKSYSMHDNRWEGENEEEKGRKEEQETEKEKDKEKDNEKEDKPKAPLLEKMVDEGLAEDDEEWEDASDGEEDDEEEDEKGEHGEDKESTKNVKPTKKTPTSPAPSTPSPKAQRTPRPKVHIPSPQETLSMPEGLKPPSPFSPLEGHQPVSDWGEEMEMLSPRSSLGESPLRPSSNESSPAQLKSNEAEHYTTPGQPEEPDKKKSTSTVVESATCETPKEAEPTESTDTSTSSSQDTADPVVPPTPESTRQSEDNEAPTVEPDESQPETKAVEDAEVDSSEQLSTG
ncbi:coiled-coil domain-containing protein 9 isoform X1 [Myxocyprinus asiaticus]|uniref:coiled-coil domain-containing protein 9 isoform X1 n=1 Tax=Myxocyprinus asiaticus TaxID=70543 RepID=UPI002221603F|nr:coiled-coil domain-containing protein 9 isoform X1 [Myxocyprinus asiaticus]XP_051522090.1 coiled-coil domain-containing protein 9 isoform X1 [Myxocyprinus asiaticus]